MAFPIHVLARWFTLFSKYFVEFYHIRQMQIILKSIPRSPWYPFYNIRTNITIIWSEHFKVDTTFIMILFEEIDTWTIIIAFAFCWRSCYCLLFFCLNSRDKVASLTTFSRKTVESEFGSKWMTRIIKKATLTLWLPLFWNRSFEVVSLPHRIWESFMHSNL